MILADRQLRVRWHVNNAIVEAKCDDCSMQELDGILGA